MQYLLSFLDFLIGGSPLRDEHVQTCGALQGGATRSIKVPAAVRFSVFGVAFCDVERNRSRSSVELVRNRLTPHGVVVVNVGHPKGNQALEKAMTATMRDVFPQVRRDPAMPTNTILVGGREVSGALQAPLTGGDVYTDDKAPVEWLIDRSLVEYAATP